MIFSYLLQMWLLHGLAAGFYLFPRYEYYEPQIVEKGFLQATYGFIALGIAGGLIAPAILDRLGLLGRASVPRLPRPGLIRVYIVTGLISYIFFLPVAGRILTATALASSFWRLLTVGLALGIWEAWQKKRQRRFILLLGVCAAGLPLLTVITEGFLGSGSMVTLALLAFVGSFFRPRWKLVLLGALIAYLGLSVYVTYMRDREDIRQVVWGGESFEGRFAQLSGSVRTLEWFDPLNEVHFNRIDDRMNQNFLVGSATDYLSFGFEEFARGETLWLAALSVIPRILWPEKPIYAGSGDLVSRFTGILFAEGTAVAIGQVMELYVNFGTAGVFLGFLVLGIVVAALDASATRQLTQGDWQGFAIFYLPGLSLIDVGSSFVESVSSAVAGFLTVYAVNRYLLTWLRGKEVRVASLGSEGQRSQAPS